MKEAMVYTALAVILICLGVVLGNSAGITALSCLFVACCCHLLGYIVEGTFDISVWNSDFLADASGTMYFMTYMFVGIYLWNLFYEC